MRLSAAAIGWVLATSVLAEAPGDFAFGIPLQIPGSEALWQIELPQSVYEGVVRPDLGDLRVLNAAGEAVPQAFLPRLTASRAAGQPIGLPFFPLRGAAALGLDGIEVHIERAEGRTVLTTSAHDPAKAGGETSLLGYLVDARGMHQPVRALAFEIPGTAGEVMTRVRVEASEDLKHWTLLAEDAPLVRLEAGGQRLVQLRVAFPARTASYFRVSWPSATPLELAALTAEPGEALLDVPRLWKQVVGVPVKDKAGAYTFDLGGQFPVDRLRVVLPQANTVVPVAILSRVRPTEQWRQVTLSTLYRLGPPGQDLVNPDLVIGLDTNRYWSLRVDPRSGGIGDGLIELAVGWVPHRLVFAARGGAPFQLAFGSATARPVAYPIATLVPGYPADADGVPPGVPIGTAIPGQLQTLAGESARQRPLDWQRWVLWGSLVLGVLTLAGMALRLARQVTRSELGLGNGRETET